MSRSRTPPLRTSLCGHKVPAEVPVLGRMSLCGHHVPDEDVSVEDVIGGDVPV